MNLLKDIESWLRSQFLISRPEGAVSRIEIRHLPLNARQGHEVLTIDGSSYEDRATWFEEQATAIETAIQCDADALGGVQRYALVPYRADKACGRKLLRVAAEEGQDGDAGFDSEPKNEKGVVSQLMRHNEALAKTLANVFSATLSAQSRQLARATEHNEKLLEQRFQSIELVEELQTQKQDRELEMMAAQRKDKLMTDIMGEVKLLGPAIVNRLQGKQVLPEAQDPFTLTVRRFAESLSMEQLQELSGKLTGPQQLAFAEILTALQGQQEH